MRSISPHSSPTGCPTRSAPPVLSRFVARLVPQTLSAIEQSGLRDFVTQPRARPDRQGTRRAARRRAALRLHRRPPPPETVRRADRRARQVSSTTRQRSAAMREKIRDELPSLFNLFRADAYLLKKIVASAGIAARRGAGRPDHPMRHEFDRFVHRLHRAAAQLSGLRQARRGAEARPAGAARTARAHRQHVERPARFHRAGCRPKIRRSAGTWPSMFVDVGRHLANDPKIRADMNQGFVVAARRPSWKARRAASPPSSPSR